MANDPIPTREVITAGDTRVELDRPGVRMTAAEVLGGAERLVYFDTADDKLQPANYDKPDGAPLRVLTSAAAKVDVSKRSVHDMGFWHRNVDHSEVIICVKGALRWETELGVHELTAGQVLCIPRGVAHRSALCDKSEEENILVELKVHDDMTPVGPIGD
ncbi:MAG: homogentisate 1,2-dioxygenase [Streptosporangiales bacterium]|nr:homogentisate 1,2-dioxygenase [Streptosporangiales bacterium]